MFFQAPSEEEQHQFEMAVMETRMRTQRFVDDMPKDDMKTFIEMLQTMADPHNGAAYAQFLLGTCTAIMRIKYKVCMCGEDHLSTEHLGKVEAKEEFKLGATSAGEEAAFTEYGMERVNGSLQCSNCKLPYVSMDDRMLRRPGMDGCHGCQEKSRHG